MEVLTIEIDTPEDKDLLLALLPKLNGRVVSDASLSKKRERLKEAIDLLRDSGVAQKYGDPSEWQREVRTDRVLYRSHSTTATTETVTR